MEIADRRANPREIILSSNYGEFETTIVYRLYILYLISDFILLLFMFDRTKKVRKLSKSQTAVNDYFTVYVIQLYLKDLRHGSGILDTSGFAHLKKFSLNFSRL